MSYLYHQFIDLSGKKMPYMMSLNDLAVRLWSPHSKTIIGQGDRQVTSCKDDTEYLLSLCGKIIKRLMLVFLG